MPYSRSLKEIMREMKMAEESEKKHQELKKKMMKNPKMMSDLGGMNFNPKKMLKGR